MALTMVRCFDMLIFDVSAEGSHLILKVFIDEMQCLSIFNYHQEFYFSILTPYQDIICLNLHVAPIIGVDCPKCVSRKCRTKN